MKMKQNNEFDVFSNNNKKKINNIASHRRRRKKKKVDYTNVPDIVIYILVSNQGT